MTDPAPNLEDDVLKWPLDLLDLPTRAYNCLVYAANARTVGDLVRKTRADLLKIRAFGEISLADVERRLARLGLRLGMVTDSSAPLPWQLVVSRLTGERDEARRQAEFLMDDCIRLLNERNAAQKERDEARRMYCQEASAHEHAVKDEPPDNGSPEDHARNHGWQYLFKEAQHA